MKPKRSPGRVTRQILSGADLSQSTASADQVPKGQPLPLALLYQILLSVLVITAALTWAIWGMAPASVILLVLALALVASWIII
jgi:hypothetical protein